jgi:hypothetical protein
MKPAVIVLLLVARGDMQQPAMAALTRAAESVLGSESHIVFHEQAKTLSDDEAIALGDQMRASMVVAVTWSGDQGRAHVHVHFSERPGWLERDVSFLATDPPPERGRTLGYAIASMVPDVAPADAAQVSRPPTRTEEKTAPSPVVRRTTSWSVGVAAAGAFAGDATSYGIGADARWSFVASGFVRAGGAARFGRVPAADASSLTVVPAVGVGFTLGESGGPARIGARIDALAIFSELSRATPPETHGRWVPGVDAMGEVELSLPPVAVGVALGPEYALGSTEVHIGTAEPATFPRWRFVSELGLRLRF